MDFAQLEQNFFISIKKKENALFSIPAEKAVHTDNMKLLLETYAPLMKALEPKAAAAYFGGWISSLPLCLQYTLSTENKTIDLSLANIEIQLYCKEGENWYFSFVVNRWSEQEGPEDEAERTVWRKQVLSKFYQQTMRPLYEAAAQVCDLDAGQLWGQLPTKFNYYIEHFMEQAKTCLIKERIEQDYRFMKEEMEPEVFGRKKNPFDVKLRYVPDWRDESKQLMQKNVCCRYYLTEEGQYCYTCPRLKESDRALRAKQLRSEMTV